MSKPSEKPKVINIFAVIVWYLRFVFFSNQIKHEKHLLPQSPINLLKQFLSGLSVVITANGLIIAHVTLWRLEENWYEYGTIWVHPDYRQHGLAKQILIHVLKEHPGKNILATTTNDVVKKLNTEVGLNLLAFDKLPKRVHAETCICSENKTGTKNNLDCQLKDGKCSLFVNY